jgi:GT2 family glycosyltransferase
VKSSEVVVVDNASTDGTADFVEPLVDHLICQRRNLGSCAKAAGAERARGEFIVFLDDDASIHPGTIRRMIQRFQADPQLAAAGFTVHGRDGGLEGTALPHVFHGCGVGFRASALSEVGGLDGSFFMQAEEYDLSFRLVGGGWSVEVFDDLHVDHLKTPCSRRNDRTAYYDIRNNLRVAARYLPAPYYRAYWEDWKNRYQWLSSLEEHHGPHARGLIAGSLRSAIERRTYRARRLKPGALEAFFRWGFVGAHVANLARQGVSRIVLADLGKNVYAFYRAAKQARVEVLAVADDRLADPNRAYRGVPIVTADESVTLGAHAIVVSNSAAVFAEQTRRKLIERTPIPVHDWFGSSGVGERRCAASTIPPLRATSHAPTADNIRTGAVFALGPANTPAIARPGTFS